MKTILDKTSIFLKSLKDWQKEIILILVFTSIGFFLSRCVLIPGTIASGSMEPTLMTGDVIITNGLSYAFCSPERGDIVSFISDEKNGITMTKRVIGIPGDDIGFYGDHVYINGVLLSEPYIPKSVVTRSGLMFHVPKNCYFMLGDNREDSFDSRLWNNPYISQNRIMGKLMIKIWHRNNYHP